MNEFASKKPPWEWRDRLIGRGTIYWVALRRWVIRSFLSLAFLRPPKAILVPGMYFLGFSKYSKRVSSFHVTALFLFASVYEKPST